MTHDPVHPDSPDSSDSSENKDIALTDATARRRWRSLPLSVGVVLATVVVATGSATAWWTWQTLSQRPSTPVTPPTAIEPEPQVSPPEALPTPTATTPATPPADTSTTTLPNERTLRVYWLQDVGDRLELSPANIALTEAQPEETRLQLAFEHLLSGTKQAALASSIPAGTRLNSLELHADGVHVDLSASFLEGGGSTAMTGRLGQVVYTATATNPDASVWISVEGKPLELLGGEGLMVAQPITRAIFDADFSL